MVILMQLKMNFKEANSKLNKILLDAKQIGLAHTNNEVDDIYNEVSQKMKTILPRVDTKR